VLHIQVHHQHLLLELPGPRQKLPIGPEYEALPVEHQLILAAHAVHVTDVGSGGAGPLGQHDLRCLPLPT